MERFFGEILRRRKTVLAVYLVLIVCCGFLSTKVIVDNDLADYLPEDSDSTIAIAEMEREFSEDIPNAQMMVMDISMTDAARLEERIRKVDGVLSVSGIEDENTLDLPYEFIGEETVKNCYKDGNALYTLTLDNDKKLDLIDELRSLTDCEVRFSGTFVTDKTAQKNSAPEIFKTVGIVVVFAIVVFMFTMDSWITPFVLVGALMAGVLINAGTNIIFGSISSVTNTASSVLQMGVSVDYFVFILHRYREYRDEGENTERAMTLALANSVTSVLSSSLTTVIGFAALIFMRYRIGLDMGVVMSKGILISLICAFTLLPCLILILEGLIQRTSHRPLIQTAYRLSDISMKIKYPAMIIFICLLIPAVFLQSHADFYYGFSHFYGDDDPLMVERAQVEEVFGKGNTTVLLVPSGDRAKENMLTEDLSGMPEIMEVTSYSSEVGPYIPYELMPEEITSLLVSEDYSRMVLILDADEESEETFELLDRIKETAEGYYGEGVYLVGDSPSTEDLKNVISEDSTKVNLIAVFAIFIVLILTMRSVKLPALLTLCIKGSIWISVSFSIIKGDPLFYIGHLIVSSILLGSTVDYAILVTNRFLEFRKELDAGNALRESIALSAVSVLTSGLILMTAGVLLGIFCSNQLMAQLGNLLARGTLTAVLVVLFALPGMISLIFRKGKNIKSN